MTDHAEAWRNHLASLPESTIAPIDAQIDYAPRRKRRPRRRRKTPDQLVTQADIARAFAVTPQAVNQWTKQASFPAAVEGASWPPRYRWGDVKTWRRRSK